MYIESKTTFRSEPRRYMRGLAWSWLAARWWIIAAPLAAVAVWACYDIRAVYVGLILLFIAFPMALTLVWFDYAFSPATRRSVMSKRLIADEKGVTIRYPDDAEEKVVRPDEFMTWDKFINYADNGRSVILIFGTRLDERIEIPADAFETDEWKIIKEHLPRYTEDTLA